MAAGYASYRPPIHPRVVGRAYRSLAMSVAARSALDVGCGAGVSTRALDGFAEHRIGGSQPVRFSARNEFWRRAWAGGLVCEL